MASPPPAPHLSIPRKRLSVSSLPSATHKRRKPSNLRNAFSPDVESVGSPRFSRSPSVDSVATNSVLNGAGGRRKRKRGDGGDAGSVTGSSIRGKGADGRSAVGGEGEGGQDYEDEEDDDDMGEEMGMAVEGGMTVEERRKQEKDDERILMEYMTPAQQERYATYRRIRLKRETVRRLVNQTLSQSVPAPVIIAVTSYTKSFLGELVDAALTVRDEWQAVKTHHPNAQVPPSLLIASLARPSAHIKDVRNKPSHADVYASGLPPHHVDREQSLWKEMEEDAGMETRLKQSGKGPLTPAHLREALRRYKRDREGGGAGFAGMSLEGVERTLGRTGGRRLFR